ncbi:MAG: PD-(D/E)XK nuclease family protein, partial [Gammaproteobacteria bacterium]|nr:PD-(D/E)XK nuclease family protein [Gammaproteobacteria bacterium]
VMGVLEAAGHEFEHLWVCGMAREIWPGQSRPDPFIPLELQRRLGMPDSSPTRNLDYAAAQVARLRASGRSLHVSWPMQEDGELLGPTPLFGELTSAPPAAAATADWNEHMQAEGGTETLAHDPPPAWPAGHKVSGGAGVLTRQAVSPLNAFIESRLGAFEMRRATVGINAMQRGNLTHRALEEFYNETPDQAAAIALSDAEREARLRASLDAGLNEIPGIREPFMRTLAAAEVEQQLERIKAFLEIDKQREPFTVAEREAVHNVEVGKLSLRLKLDRLDVLEDERRIVIDYKTGQVDRQGWNPDNPRDLQLPLYVTCIAPDAAAVAFAQVSSRGVGYDGVGNGDVAIPGLRSPGRRNVVEVKFQYPYTRDVIESWDELRRVWTELLVRLADEFAAGDFRYDPRNPDSARGQFAVLSRIYDAGPQFFTDTGDEA